MKCLFIWLLSLPLMGADPRVEYAMGVKALTRGDESLAQEQFEKAFKLDPKALPLVRKLASLRLRVGDRAGAVKLFKGLAEASPHRVEVQLAYAGILEQAGGKDAATNKLVIGILEKALKEDPDNRELISRLLNLFRVHGESARAAKLMEQLPMADPESAQIYASMSQVLFKGDDLAARDRVDVRYRSAIAEHPKDVDLARAASEYFRGTGRMDEAIHILKSHIEAAPWSLDLRTRLGILLFSAKRDSEGVATLKEVIEIRPVSELALQSLAKYYRLKGEEKEARFYGAELLKVKGGSPQEYVTLADEFLAAEDPRSARLLLEKGVFVYPDKPDLAMKLAVATRQDPETKANAGRLFREAEILMGDIKPDAIFLMESADCLLEEGKSKAAEDRLRTAIKSFQPDQKKEIASAMRRLARLWESENRNGDAAKALKQRADALDPP